jgi:alpha-glucosidase
MILRALTVLIRRDFLLNIFFVCLLILPCSAQRWESLPGVAAARKLPNGIELGAGKAKIIITAISDSVVRVRVSQNGVFFKDTSWAVLPDMSSAAPAAQVNNTANTAEVVLHDGRVRISKNPLQLTFLNAAGTVINEDDPEAAISFAGTSFRVTKKMPEDENYFGLGDKTSLNLREHAYTMWNTDAYGWEESTDPLYKTIPFFIGVRQGSAYGIFLDNTWRSFFDFGKESHDKYSFGADGGELNYYFFFGPNPKQVVTAYAALTGKAPLPPLWSLGFQQCRYSYYPEARVREVAQTFREKKIPADVIYLDIDYQDRNRPFTIDRQRFPNFEGMIKDLGRQGFKIIAITDLHIAHAPGYRPYDQGIAGDHFVKNPDGTIYVGKVWPGDSVFPEFTLTRSREWWGTLYKDFVGMGIAGFWNDMNEPALFARRDKTMPLTTVHRLDDGSKLDHRAVHNMFGMQNSRGTYEGLLKLQGNERPFVLTRATYSGGQRYAASWTGDNSSTWNHMRMSVPNLLSLGISGFAYVGDDIGGFRGSPPPDLLTRWIALGAFNPIYRDHTEKGSADQEPWVHGPEHEAIRKKFIEQRYRMLPYIYTIAEEASRTGLPMMRPLFLEFPKGERVAATDEEFMFGPRMLVAPKVWEFVTAYEVQLPQGDWYDYWTGVKIPASQNNAGGTLKVTPGLDELPVYVRAGSILPQQPLVQNTQEIPRGPLELLVFPGDNCSGDLYLDDGHTFNYQRGEYLRTSFSCSVNATNSVAVQINAAQGSYKPWFQQLELKIYDAKAAPRSVKVGETPAQNFHYDAAQKMVSVTVPFVSTGTKIEVSY